MPSFSLKTSHTVWTFKICVELDVIAFLGVVLTILCLLTVTTMCLLIELHQNYWEAMPPLLKYGGGGALAPLAPLFLLLCITNSKIIFQREQRSIRQ